MKCDVEPMHSFFVTLPLLCSLFGVGPYSICSVCRIAIGLFSVKIVVGCIWHIFSPFRITKQCSNLQKDEDDRLPDARRHDCIRMPAAAKQ